MDQQFLDLLACPRCDQAIDYDGTDLVSKGAGTRFPIVDGVPFLFAEPAAAMDDWRSRYHARLAEIDDEVVRLEQAVQAEGILASTGDRLRHHRDALRAHREELVELLTPVDLRREVADHSTYLALRTRLPSDQGLATYYANLHRDWCWGDAENRRSFELVQSATAAEAVGRLLVLGSGGGRLSYDLHQNLNPDCTVAVDFNPLLVLAAQQVMRGNQVDLHEFPLAPIDAKSVACARTLRAPEPVSDNFYHVLANVLRAPFKPESFDTLVTPWLSDVLSEPLALQAARWNQLLRPGGRWIWFGSHVFRTADPAERVSLEESLEIIGAQGFSDPAVIESEIPYMVSPANRHARSERVVVISMTKSGPCEKPPRHVALPEWLVRGDLAVPLNDSFQSQAMSTRIHAFLMSMIDGQRTIQQMAALMESERLMSKSEAEATLRSFFIQMYEVSNSYQSL
ncbi:MAG: hypothetical protein AAFN07_10025 [Pseudomonadota bacterium]